MKTDPKSRETKPASADAEDKTPPVNRKAKTKVLLVDDHPILRAGLRKLIDHHFPDLPFFGRDSTEAGAKIMRHLGFFPFGATPHLFWRCCSVMDEEAA